MKASRCYRQTNARVQVTSPATADVNNDCISLQPFHDEEDFGTLTLTEVEENELLLTIGDTATKASNNPNSSVSMSAAEIGDVHSFQMRSTIHGQKFMMMALTCCCFLLKKRIRSICFGPSRESKLQ